MNKTLSKLLIAIMLYLPLGLLHGFSIQLPEGHSLIMEPRTAPISAHQHLHSELFH